MDDAQDDQGDVVEDTNDQDAGNQNSGNQDNGLTKLVDRSLTVFPASQVPDRDLAVFAVQNRVRTNPEEFYDYMNDMLANFVGTGIRNGCGPNCTMRT